MIAVAIRRWIQVYGPEQDKRCQRRLKQITIWQLDETWITKCCIWDLVVYRDSCGRRYIM